MLAEILVIIKKKTVLDKLILQLKLFKIQEIKIHSILTRCLSLCFNYLLQTNKQKRFKSHRLQLGMVIDTFNSAL